MPTLTVTADHVAAAHTLQVAIDSFDSFAGLTPDQAAASALLSMQWRYTWALADSLPWLPATEETVVGIFARIEAERLFTEDEVFSALFAGEDARAVSALASLQEVR